MTGKLTELLSQDRTWTARQLADALDIGIGHRQTRRYLALLKAGYRRTVLPAIGHKHDPLGPYDLLRVVLVADGRQDGPAEGVEFRVLRISEEDAEHEIVYASLAMCLRKMRKAEIERLRNSYLTKSLNPAVLR